MICLEDAMPWLFGILIVSVIGGAITLAIRQDKEWEAFKVAHDCHVTAKMAATTNPGFDAKGNVTWTTTPEKEAWSCNDGITYWR